MFTGQLTLGNYMITVGVGSVSGPPDRKQEEKEASETGSKKGQQCVCPDCVWFSLNENKSGATWITTRTGGHREMNSFRFLVPVLFLVGKKTVGAKLYHLKIRSEKTR